MGFKKLTRQAVSKLEVGQKILENGIIAERTPNGDVSYRINVMVNGRRIHRIVGRDSDGTTRTQAEEAIATLKTRAKEDRLDLPKGRKVVMSFKQAAEGYIKRLDEGGGKDLANKRRHMEQRIIPHFGAHRCDRIGTHDIASYAQGRLAEGAKQATVNRELSTLSHFFNRAAEWSWIKNDDRPRIVKGAEPRKAITVLTKKDSENLMRAARQDIDERLYLFVAFGLNTAMRHSEIVSVRYDKIDFENNRIFIPYAKGGAREQPVTASMIALLSERRLSETDKNGWVFPSINKSKYPHRQNMDAGFKRAVIAAGLSPSKVTPHIMRHTAITRLVQANIDLPTIQKISAHKTLSMVLRYTHVHGTHIDQALNAIDTGR